MQLGYFQVTAEPRATGTDANAMQVNRSGVATALVSIPNRYMHSPVETISLDDIDRAADVIAPGLRHQASPGGGGRSLLSPEQVDLTDRLRQLAGGHRPFARVDLGDETPWASALVRAYRGLPHATPQRARRVARADDRKIMANAYPQGVVHWLPENPPFLRAATATGTP